MSSFRSSRSTRRFLPIIFFFLMLRPPPSSTPFPYTTLFRSAPDSGRSAIWNARMACIAPVFVASLEAEHRLGGSLALPSPIVPNSLHVHRRNSSPLTAVARPARENGAGQPQDLSRPHERRAAQQAEGAKRRVRRFPQLCPR